MLFEPFFVVVLHQLVVKIAVGGDKRGLVYLFLVLIVCLNRMIVNQLSRCTAFDLVLLIIP